jgi:AcrR family transcriptional regulator
VSARAKDTNEPRDTLNRERVLRAAVELADRGGIDALTMRELGRSLGVEAASLYNHVSGKDDVLDGMVDRVVAEIDLPAGDVDWKEALRRRAVSAQLVFARHAWAAALIDSRQRSGPSSLSYADRVLGTLLRAGFTPKVAGVAFLVLDSYIYGFERQRSYLALTDDADTTEVADEVVAAIPQGEYPSLASVAAAFSVEPFDDQAAFEFGLGMLLDGLERMLESG